MNFKSVWSMLLLALFSVLAISCSRDTEDLAPKNEVAPTHNEDKGHDNATKVEIIVRAGHLHGPSFHGNGPVGKILPEIQKITIEDTPSGRVTKIDKGNILKPKNPEFADAIEVLASPDGWAAYSMEIIYYNSNNERINSQFITPEMINIHQHFFTIDSYKNYKTGEVKKTSKKGEYFTNLHDYVYRDTKIENKMFDRTSNPILDNPIGLKGYFKFKEDAAYASFNMKVRFRHFYGSKFFTSGKAASANNPQGVMTRSESDFEAEIPFIVITYRGEEEEAYVKDLAEYYGVSTDEIEEYVEQQEHSSNFWL